MRAESRPRRIVAGVLVRGPRVLLCRRRSDRSWYAGVWDLPGGHVEWCESLHEALVRELSEELGVVVLTAAPRAEATVSDAHLTVFTVSTWSGEPVNAAPEEHDLVGWFTAAEALDLHLADDRLGQLIKDLTRESGIKECKPESSWTLNRTPNEAEERPCW